MATPVQRTTFELGYEEKRPEVLTTVSPLHLKIKEKAFSMYPVMSSPDSLLWYYRYSVALLSAKETGQVSS